MRASDFFSQGLRQHVFVEREVSDEPFEPAIFFFHLSEAPQLAHAEMGKILFPGVGRGGTHSELSAEVTDRGAGFNLPDRVDNLFFRGFDRFMGPLLSCETTEAAIVFGRDISS